MTSFAGWQMPLRYGSEMAEHLAVRRAAGLFDLSHMGEIAVTGPDAGAVLDYALTGQPSALPPGRARYTMICAEDGGVLDDLVVYRRGEQEFLVIANASNTATVFGALADRAEGYDAAVVDATQDYALIAVQGPAAAGILAPLVQLDPAGPEDPGWPELGAMKYYAGAFGTVAGREACGADRVHRREWLRAVLPAPGRRACLDGGDRRGRWGRPGPGRPGGPRYAPA